VPSSVFRRLGKCPRSLSFSRQIHISTSRNISEAVWPETSRFAIVPAIVVGASSRCARQPISSGKQIECEFEKELPKGSGVPLTVQYGLDSTIVDPTGEGSPMKSSIAALGLISALAASPAWAQTQTPTFGGAQPNSPRSPIADAAAAPFDNRVIKATSGAPSLTPANDLRPPTVALPGEPIEPYLLAKENGPFMVLARVFRGKDAERMALALVKELRNDYNLPAYILRTKDFPGKSMIRGVPPTVPSNVMAPEIRMPEKIRTFDEAAVLVGNEKTTADSEKLLSVVRKIDPKCLKGMSSPFGWRHGLSAALRTTNPYVPAQLLYPRKADRLMVQMNSGLRSVVNCPGRYSLQVAEFSGRSTFQLNPAQQPLGSLLNLKESPLRTAQDDAERMAEKLAKDAEVMRMGQPIYILHDRTSSRVFIGSFDSAQDPRAGEVRDKLLRLAVPLVDKSSKGRGKNALDTMIVPALALTDLNDIKGKIRN
jgi:hypothetical protein